VLLEWLKGFATEPIFLAAGAEISGIFALAEAGFRTRRSGFLRHEPFAAGVRRYDSGSIARVVELVDTRDLSH
jgi:hypothetical protein